MPRFVVMALAALLPVRSWRTAFRRKMNGKGPFANLKGAFAEIKAKRDAVLQGGDACRIMVLGSSHGAYGVDPRFIGADCFNLCSNSQDLYTAEQLFMYMRKRLHNLEKVVVLLDVFSRGWRLERTSARHICAAYNYLYGVQYPECRNLKGLLRRCRKLDGREIHVAMNHNGYLAPPRLDLADTVADRVGSHLKNYRRKDSQYVHLDNIVRNGDGLGIVVLIPPLRSDYRQLLPKGVPQDDARKLLAGTEARVVDLSSDASFTDDCFYDYDHLNSRGAEMLSRKLNDLL